MYLIKTKDGAECVKESNDVEEDEGGEDGTAETNLIPIAKHLKSSKCPKSAGPKNRPMVKYAYLRASNARASFVNVPEKISGKNAHLARARVMGK